MTEGSEGRLPVSVITGFLGSGKTTLLARLLGGPDFAETAVIVNEFGEIGLDHELIETSDESVVQLTTGCLCCAMRSDVAETLLDLARRRDAGSVPPFKRVVIETSGLADPAPILHALMADRALLARFSLQAVLTVIDAVHGAAALDRHPEALRQAAMADALLLSKTDLVAPPPALLHRLAAMNPSARMGTTAEPGLVERLLSNPHIARDAPATPRHTEGVGTAVILRERALPGVAVALLLQALTAHAGARLLRVKGLIDIEESPGRPMLVHGVQHVFEPPVFLPRWPGADRRSRLVVISQGIPPHWPSRLLDAIEAEVRDQSVQRSRDQSAQRRPA